MRVSTTFLFTAIMAFVRVAAATPPACLIAVMGVQPNPSDLKALCGTLQDSVTGNITEKCEGNESAAMSVYSATCLSSESVTISMTSSAPSSSKTSHASATSTGSSDGEETGSGSVTGGSTGSGGIAIATGGPTPTAASSSPDASSTGNSAGTKSPRIAIAVLAAGFAGQYLL